MTAPLRVALVNDHELVVAGLAAVLSRFPERIEVVELDMDRPVAAEVDVVLYDTFAGEQGSDMTLDGLRGPGDARIVAFSWNTQRAIVREALDAGAAGYVAKSASADELVDALERVGAGEEVVPGEQDGEDYVGDWPGRAEGLSARESEVLALICAGLSNQDIVDRAYIGMNTLKTHIRRLYAKLGVDSRTRALLWGVDHGFRADRGRLRKYP